MRSILIVNAKHMDTPYIMRLYTFLLILIFPFFLVACASLSESEKETKDWPASRFYERGKERLNAGDYEKAVKDFETLVSRYPFGPYAQQAQLEIAYAYYKYDESESSIAAADHFIKLYPRHPNVDYAYYVKGLANFTRGIGGLERLFGQDPSERDPRAARESLQHFTQLVKLFPNSKYAQDAAQRTLYLYNNLARYEIHVANYYMRRGAYLAAANRAKYVIENYPTTTATPDALGIMAKAYKLLGMNDLSIDALRVLEMNYPQSPYLAEVRKLTVRN
ncbi:MAG: outer membrane protein assembly factor BamD [Pseudomonadota bacterium]